MAPEEILIHQRATGVRTGRQIDRTDDGYVIQWDDESGPVTLRTWPIAIQRVAVGSVQHRAVTELPALVDELAKEPENLFVALLRDSHRAMKGAELTAALTVLGLDTKAVTTGWRRVKDRVGKNPHVRVSGPPAVFEWTPVARDPEAELRGLPVLLMLEQLTESTTTGAQREAARSRLTSSPPEALSERLAAAALGLISWPSPAQLSEARSNPLAIGGALAALSDRLLSRAADRAEAEGLFDALWLLASTGRPAKPLTRLGERLSESKGAVATAGDLVARVADELGAKAMPSKEEMSGAIAILSRLAGLTQESAESTASVLKVIISAPDHSSSKGQLIAAAMNALKRAKPDVIQGALELVDARSALVSAAMAPLEPASGRAQLIAAAYRLNVDLATDPDVWRGVGANQLDQLTLAGELTAVLGRPELGGTLARIVRQAVASVETRAQLAIVLSWSTLLLGRLPISDLSEALRRVMQHDASVRGAIDGLSAQAELLSLREQVAAARAAAAESERLLGLAREETAVARHKSDALAEELRERVSGVYEATDAQRRQFQIDGVRSAVALLMEFDRAFDDSPPAAAIRTRLLQSASRHGITPIGVPGEEIDFDRQQHELVAGPEQPTATVIRSGYSWTIGKSTTVLTRALVSTVK
jgi:hypothetical protein